MSRARLFNGRVAVPVEGTVEINSESLVFTPSGGRQSARFDPGRVREVRRLPGRQFQVDVVAPDGTVAAMEVEDVDLLPNVIRGMWKRRPVSAARAYLHACVPPIIWILLLAMILPLGYWGYTEGAGMLHHLVPTAWEKDLGGRIEQQLTRWYPAQPHNADLPELRDLADRLSDPDSPFEIQVMVVKTPMVNAFALPGGRVCFTTGFLNFTRDRAEWAGVIAHEIAHCEQRHSLQAIGKSLGAGIWMSAALGGGGDGTPSESVMEAASVLLELKYSRNMEAEADRIAVDRLRKVEMDPMGLVRFLEKIQRGETGGGGQLRKILSSHPPTPERVEALRARITEY